MPSDKTDRFLYRRSVGEFDTRCFYGSFGDWLQKDQARSVGELGVKKADLKTFVVLALIAAVIPALKAYAVQEILVVLLTIAATALVMLLAVVALLLFWEAVHLIFVWLTPTVGRTARAGRSALNHVMGAPLSRR